MSLRPQGSICAPDQAGTLFCGEHEPPSFGRGCKRQRLCHSICLCPEEQLQRVPQEAALGEIFDAQFCNMIKSTYTFPWVPRAAGHPTGMSLTRRCSYPSCQMTVSSQPGMCAHCKMVSLPPGRKVRTNAGSQNSSRKKINRRITKKCSVCWAQVSKETRFHIEKDFVAEGGDALEWLWSYS